MALLKSATLEMARRRFCCTGSKRSGKLEDVNKSWATTSVSTFIRMLNKAPKLKSTVKMKMKSNMNMRPASEAMVTYSTILNPELNFFVLFMANANCASLFSA